jgi:beta-glucosidase
MPCFVSAGVLLRRRFLLPLVVMSLLGVQAQAQSSECAGSLTPVQLDGRIDSLIAQMTNEERIAQLQDRAPAIPRLGIPAYNWWNEGLHGIARNGYATVFPQAIGLAATADPELMQAVGEVISTEARAKFNPHANADSPRYAGLTLWSPNINIFRDPRWGRGQETYGEDPYLTATLASGFLRGIQGDPQNFYRRADGTPKHFAVHSGPESIRDGFNSVVSMHDLNDTYLPAFRHVIDEGHAAAVMCSYNAINGLPACANDPLIEGRMRKEWGFQGYVVSDCDAVGEVTDYLHYTADSEHGSAASLKSGVDLDCGSTYRHLNGALQQGLVTEADINRSLHRLLLTRMRLGMLQPASCSPYAAITATEVDAPAHRALALRAAEESIVLLRNDKTASGKTLLPLDVRGKTIAVIGPSAELLSVIEANYHGTAYRAETLLAGLRRTLPAGTRLLYAQGSNLASGATVPIPSTAFLGGSLQGAYFRNARLEGSPAWTRKDSTVDFDFDHVSPAVDQKIARADTSDQPYSVRWTGQVKPPAAGDYRLRVIVDRCFDCKGHDGYRLWIDQKLVLEDSGAPVAKDAKPLPDSVHLDWKNTAPHAVRLELLHTGEDQGIHLEWEAPAEVQRAEAVAVARKADVILALVGISPDLEGEALSIKIPGFTGGDRDDLRLPELQRKLLQALAELHKPIVLGITSGSPIATASVSAAISAPQAILQLWYPGEEGGVALAHLLTGAVSPSGRMPLTVYRSASDLPVFIDYSMEHRGYRHLAADAPVEYRFGFGLSYSHFDYSKPILNTNELSIGGSLRVEATVRNAGDLDADEVAELYLIPPAATGAPRLSLQGLQRLHLKAGESRQVVFTLLPRQLSTVSEDGRRLLRPDTYKVVVGGAQPEDEQTAATFQMVGAEVRLPD